MAIDKTYALRGIDVVQLRQGRGYIGTAFHPKVLRSGPGEIDQQNTGFLPFQNLKSLRQSAGLSTKKLTVDLEEDEVPEQEDQQDAPQGPRPEQSEDAPAPAWDASSLDYANEVCEFLCFDPLLEKVPRLSVASVPTSYLCTGHDMLLLVGQVLAHAGSIVKCIACDNASTHAAMKNLLLGLPHGLSEAELSQLPFWREIKYVPFPGSSLPRWPYSKPCINGEVLFLASSALFV